MPPSLVLQTLDRIWQELYRQHLSVTLVGGLALPVWNYPRSTQDIDLLLLTDDDQQLLKICQSLGCRPRRTPTFTELGSVRVLQTEFCPPDEYVEIEIDFLIGQSEFHAQVAQRSIEVNYQGLAVPIKVATCEDLILLKLQAGRMIDLADCQRLIELNAELAWAYVEDWAAKLELVESLTSVRQSR